MPEWTEKTEDSFINWMASLPRHKYKQEVKGGMASSCPNANHRRAATLTLSIFTPLLRRHHLNTSVPWTPWDMIDFDVLSQSIEFPPHQFTSSNIFWNKGLSGPFSLHSAYHVQGHSNLKLQGGYEITVKTVLTVIFCLVELGSYGRWIQKIQKVLVEISDWLTLGIAYGRKQIFFSVCLETMRVYKINTPMLPNFARWFEIL